MAIRKVSVEETELEEDIEDIDVRDFFPHKDEIIAYVRRMICENGYPWSYDDLWDNVPDIEAGISELFE